MWKITLTLSYLFTTSNYRRTNIAGFAKEIKLSFNLSACYFVDLSVVWRLIFIGHFFNIYKPDELKFASVFFQNAANGLPDHRRRPILLTTQDPDIHMARRNMNVFHPGYTFKFTFCRFVTRS